MSVHYKLYLDIYYANVQIVAVNSTASLSY